MSQIEQLLNEFPEESRQILSAVWQTLPQDRQSELLELIPILAGRPAKIQKIFELSRDQLAMSFGNKHKVAIVGPTNVGKSTLYNQLIEESEEAAQVSPVPGTTRANQQASAGPFSIVDTPGADAVGDVGAQERQLALSAAAEADFIVIVFDAVQGVKRSEKALFEDLVALRKPFLVVLNKMDLVEEAEQAVVAQVATNLGLKAQHIVPIVATTGQDVKRVVMAIVKAEPALVTALGQGLPHYRWQLAWRLITGAASTSGLIAMTPLPFVDFIPLLAVQISLILGIARIYNYRMSFKRWREIVSVFGFGYIGRTLFYELTKLGGPPAWVAAAAVAAGTTVALGYGAIIWFERGERITRGTGKKIIRVVRDYLVDTLKRDDQEKSSRKKLSERIREALEQSDLGRDRHALDQIQTGDEENG